MFISFVMIEVDEVLNVKMRSDVLYILKSKQKQNKVLKYLHLAIERTLFHRMIVNVMEFIKSIKSGLRVRLLSHLLLKKEKNLQG